MDPSRPTENIQEQHRLARSVMELTTFQPQRRTWTSQRPPRPDYQILPLTLTQAFCHEVLHAGAHQPDTHIQTIPHSLKLHSVRIKNDNSKLLHSSIWNCKRPKLTQQFRSFFQKEIDV